ncbi:MAG: terminase small subunit [Gammaproteobacteria bacterium]
MAKMGARRRKPKNLVDGRVREPNKYTEELVLKTEVYIKEREENNTKIPTICGLALFLDINQDTIYVWRNDADKKNFSEAIRKLLSVQEEMLLQKGLSNDFNANITKLALHNHGYTDKQEIQTTEKPYENVSDEELARQRKLLQDEINEEEA